MMSDNTDIRILEKLIKNKITEQEFNSIMESLNHIFIYFLGIPSGIDIVWDYSNFYYYVRHIGIQQSIPSAFTKIIATKENRSEALCYGVKNRKVSLFDLPQAYYELKQWLISNKYYFVNIENHEG